jgi:hypothetical protein
MFKVIKTAEQVAQEKTEKEISQRIEELKQLLSASDFKVIPDYDKPNDDIKVIRQSWRNELRALEGKE